LGLPEFSQANAKQQVMIKGITVPDGLAKTINGRIAFDILHKELEAAIQGTRMFQVLTRDQELLQAILEEQEFAQSDKSAGDAAFEGDLKNADLIFFPELTAFSFYRTLKDVPNLPGKYKRTDRGSLGLHIVIVDTQTGVKVGIIRNKVSFKTASELTSDKSKIPATGNLTKMLKDISSKSADSLVDHLFPMKVIKRSGTKVYLSRGDDGSLRKGMILNVYNPGEALINPDTGENLGSAEEYVGQIKIERVNPKFSIAIMQKSELAEEIGPGFIVRKPN
jgi:hypothetical protein